MFVLNISLGARRARPLSHFPDFELRRRLHFSRMVEKIDTVIERAQVSHPQNRTRIQLRREIRCGNQVRSPKETYWRLSVRHATVNPA